jgi:hypothetical protein
VNDREKETTQPQGGEKVFAINQALKLQAAKAAARPQARLHDIMGRFLMETHLSLNDFCRTGQPTC